MALTPQQVKQLEQLPRPPMPSVALVDSKTGRPTKAFTDYLTRLDAWQRDIVNILLGAL